ncbi:uncharacterized protein N7496_011021 [Penicillium cataractarum]|uniref:Bacteriophage T5 Orf172 DNA-binding domain-containing protein n=1 Tax=Penicillium cataractarum TaxID=2100454 RepID=A0A9W9RE76_9EURO|nr:uncharacterized protein N7496_011021 [Penicillium cataractarum]KAJ5358608.1 hypothetical protein N7496_011021 [Penicillium cataractarum]
MKPTEGFCDLSVLLFDIHESSHQQECVFHQVDEHGTQNCIIEIREEDCNLARSHFNDILFIRNVYCDERQNTSKVLDVFNHLAGLLLCGEHASYRRPLRLQWVREFKERRSEILSELEDYYGKPGSSDGAEDDKKEVFADPSRPFATKELTRLCLKIDEEGVAKKVTKVLDQQLGAQSRETGCVYIISPQDTEFQGVLKIGYSKKHPQAARFINHERCFGEFEIIKMRPVTYARRVEQLLLSEFSRVRYKKYCEICKTTHLEWLKIDSETLVESLNKWCDFFDKVNTYKKDGEFMTLPEEGLELPSPVLPEHLRQNRCVSWTPSKGTPRGKTPSKDSASKGSSKKKKPSKDSPKKDTPIEGAPTQTVMETPTKTFRPQSSSSTSPSYPQFKIPTITTTVIPSSDKLDSMPEGNDVDREESEVGGLTSAIRRLNFKPKSAP